MYSRMHFCTEVVQCALYCTVSMGSSSPRATLESHLGQPSLQSLLACMACDLSFCVLTAGGCSSFHIYSNFLPLYLQTRPCTLVNVYWSLFFVVLLYIKAIVIARWFPYMFLFFYYKHNMPKTWVIYSHFGPSGLMEVQTRPGLLVVVLRALYFFKGYYFPYYVAQCLMLITFCFPIYHGDRFPYVDHREPHKCGEPLIGHTPLSTILDIKLFHLAVVFWLHDVVTVSIC